VVLLFLGNGVGRRLRMREKVKVERKRQKMPQDQLEQVSFPPQSLDTSNGFSRTGKEEDILVSES